VHEPLMQSLQLIRPQPGINKHPTHEQTNDPAVKPSRQEPLQYWVASCRSRFEPDECAGQGDGGEAAVGTLVVAGGDAPPLLEAVEAAFDDVAA
ncbi:hypothetical protein, partial [Streptomyces djakartensis]|uniref:hypothetical protein n=1 Tax=Streptomyces djakartensis TaxID=68193 RepID=UPI003F81F705